MKNGGQPVSKPDQELDATKPIYLQVRELKEMWQELWFKMAGGVISEYNRIKQINLFEFYALFDLWREEVGKEKKNLKRKVDQHGK